MSNLPVPPWASAPRAVKWASDSNCLRAVVLQGEGLDDAPRGCTAMSGDNFGLSQLGRGQLVASSRDAPQHLTLLRTARQENDLAPNVSSAQGEKPDSRGLIRRFSKLIHMMCLALGRTYNRCLIKLCYSPRFFKAWSLSLSSCFGFAKGFCSPNLPW